ncbi:Methylthioribulose-1-phosphate dehydratase [Strongyloides ratti]|uniref:Methylthioribulose-1-phosphate dehydratase n=1 Tax=Strongyloides ratti TaxID=34506 RepID=A0A090MV87_STRRB|nr:Methylthioribulose-1-phosphate dehydratase [Strongyloides ratti]CEF62728.1 Methylthioribulose-1-phosphate dehydratase [Strongyloides ratti]
MDLNDTEEMNDELFIQLMTQFYNLGWMYGSSGGMACCTDSDEVIYSPSSVQKERLTKNDIFIYNRQTNSISYRPKNENIKESACTPLFNYIINKTKYQCIIHTHSKYSNLLTQLIDKKSQNNIYMNRDEFCLNNQEMIKGIINRETNKNFNNTETIRIPIIENKPFEHQLLPDIAICLEKYPTSCAILVRNHGFFVFGPTWQRTKIMLECCEYLFELACDMINNNIDLIKINKEI